MQHITKRAAHGIHLFLVHRAEERDDLSGLIGRGIYAGGWLEAGNAWQSSQEASLSDLHYTSTLALGMDSFFGPLYLAYGHADGGRDAFYLSMGRSIGGPRQYGFSHY